MFLLHKIFTKMQLNGMIITSVIIALCAVDIILTEVCRLPLLSDTTESFNI